MENPSTFFGIQKSFFFEKLDNGSTYRGVENSRGQFGTIPEFTARIKYHENILEIISIL